MKVTGKIQYIFLSKKVDTTIGFKAVKEKNYVIKFKGLLNMLLKIGIVMYKKPNKIYIFIDE